jgi:hypothetical protein
MRDRRRSRAYTVIVGALALVCATAVPIVLVRRQGLSTAARLVHVPVQRIRPWPGRYFPLARTFSVWSPDGKRTCDFYVAGDGQLSSLSFLYEWAPRVRHDATGSALWDGTAMEIVSLYWPADRRELRALREPLGDDGGWRIELIDLCIISSIQLWR